MDNDTRSRIRKAGEDNGWRVTVNPRAGGDLDITKDGVTVTVSFTAAGGIRRAERSHGNRFRSATGQDRAWQVIVWLAGEPQRFHEYQRVVIHYPNPVAGGRVDRRLGTVHRDDGGSKVLVEWVAEDGPKVGRRVVAWHGEHHEQWIPRERLTGR